MDHAKRGADIVLASMALLLCSPVLLVAACWIYVLDGGPVLYSQWRVGRDGWLFRIYKLRTMRRNAEEDGAVFASPRDSRVLPLCHLLRKTHVDELPQLWNILRGEMSLVGPRPERPEMIESLRDVVPSIERRLAGLPGITGLAQLHHGYTNDAAGARRKLAADLRYLRTRTFARDLMLMLRTVPRFWDRSAM